MKATMRKIRRKCHSPKQINRSEDVSQQTQDGLGLYSSSLNRMRIFLCSHTLKIQIDSMLTQTVRKLTRRNRTPYSLTMRSINVTSPHLIWTSLSSQLISCKSMPKRLFDYESFSNPEPKISSLIFRSQIKPIKIKTISRLKSWVGNFQDNLEVYKNQPLSTCQKFLWINDTESTGECVIFKGTRKLRSCIRLLFSICAMLIFQPCIEWSQLS